MSDDVLKIIPADSRFIPSSNTHDRAVTLLEEMLPDGEMCEAKSFETLQFIDAGENHEAVICPACGARLALNSFQENDPAMDWWFETQDAMQNLPIETIQTTMRCCNAVVPLTSVHFDWPAGFAHFELCIWNPNIDRNLNDSEMAKLEAVLGCKLRQVRAHY